MNIDVRIVPGLLKKSFGIQKVRGCNALIAKEKRLFGCCRPFPKRVGKWEMECLCHLPVGLLRRDFPEPHDEEKNREFFKD
jgi:hypothetical protein